jgi:cytochrome P450
LAAGTGIEMMWGAGNLDPAAFPEPERFDPSRRLQGTTIFGGGGHICPGRHAALMLTRILLETMDRDGVVLTPVGEPQWLDRHALCQLASMPVRVRRAGGVGSMLPSA